MIETLTAFGLLGVPKFPHSLSSKKQKTITVQSDRVCVCHSHPRSGPGQTGQACVLLQTHTLRNAYHTVDAARLKQLT